MAEIKTFVYINRKAPYGSIYALESLEVVLIGAAFDQRVKLVFMDDGVYQLTTNQDPGGIGMKNFSKTYGALGDYDVTEIYVDEESLQQRGLNIEDLQALVYEDEDDDGCSHGGLVDLYPGRRLHDGQLEQPAAVG